MKRFRAKSTRTSRDEIRRRLRMSIQVRLCQMGDPSPEQLDREIARITGPAARKAPVMGPRRSIDRETASWSGAAGLGIALVVALGAVTAIGYLVAHSPGGILSLTAGAASLISLSEVIFRHKRETAQGDRRAEEIRVDKETEHERRF